MQINVQIQTHLKRINIVDVLKPTEDFTDLDENSIDDTEQSAPEVHQKKKNVVQWQVDLSYKREQERLKIPSDPMKW